MLWIIDGYTTTDAFPYSKATTLGDATSDSLTANSRSVVSQARDDINYIRNSVKATVDAYDGTVTLYEWDPTDPVLQTWSKAFPGIVQPRSAISADLLAHLRYPEDLFKVQRKILAQYHVTDANNFYYGTDFWSIPDDPAKRVAQPQPPYYLQVQMPGDKTPVFSLTTTFAPQKRPTLAAFMAVDSEPGPNYGKIEILKLPDNTTIPGPAQVQNNFETDPVVKQQLTLLRGSGSSDIDYGNLLSLPVGGGVLYVEPVYIRAGGTAGYPLLKKVLVGFGAKVAFQDTIGEALAELFGTGTGTVKPPRLDRAHQAPDGHRPAAARGGHRRGPGRLRRPASRPSRRATGRRTAMPRTGSRRRWRRRPPPSGRSPRAAEPTPAATESARRSAADRRGLRFALPRRR